MLSGDVLTPKSRNQSTRSDGLDKGNIELFFLSHDRSPIPAPGPTLHATRQRRAGTATMRAATAKSQFRTLRLFPSSTAARTLRIPATVARKPPKCSVPHSPLSSPLMRTGYPLALNRVSDIRGLASVAAALAVYVLVNWRFRFFRVLMPFLF